MMDHYDEIHKWCLILKIKSDELQQLATAFYKTGNETMYINLSNIAQDLFDAQKKINEAMRDKLHLDYQEMVSNTGKILDILAKKEISDDNQRGL